jgi:hypothetical protein
MWNAARDVTRGSCKEVEEQKPEAIREKIALRQTSSKINKW